MPSLTLNRAAGESIQIGDTITIHFDWIGGKSCQVRIEAPPTVRIYRSELLGQPATPSPAPREPHHNPNLRRPRR